METQTQKSTLGARKADKWQKTLCKLFCGTAIVIKKIFKIPQFSDMFIVTTKNKSSLVLSKSV